MENEKRGRGKELQAKPARLAELVAYQEASIVSRTLVNTKSGTVTLFAFDEGQSLTEHTSPFDAMVIVLDGSSEITISGKSHRVQPGEIILMPAHQPHAVKAVERFKMLLIMIRA